MSLETKITEARIMLTSPSSGIPIAEMTPRAGDDHQRLIALEASFGIVLDALDELARELKKPAD